MEKTRGNLGMKEISSPFVYFSVIDECQDLDTW